MARRIYQLLPVHLYRVLVSGDPIIRRSYRALSNPFGSAGWISDPLNDLLARRGTIFLGTALGSMLSSHERLGSY
jgi:hypothetical protein